MKQFKPYCIAFLFRSKHFVFPIFQSVPTKTKMMWCGILKTFYALKRLKINDDKFRKNKFNTYGQTHLITALKV